MAVRWEFGERSATAAMLRIKPTGAAAEGLNVLRTAWWAVWGLLVLVGALSGARMSEPVPYDLVAFSRSGLAVLTGRWGGVYATDWLQAGPFELVCSYLLLPQHLPLDRGQLLGINPIQAGTGVVVGRAVAAAVLVGAVPLLVRLLRRRCDLAASPGAELGAAALCLLLRLPTGVLAVGHLAQLVVPLLWVVAAVTARRGRTGCAGVLVGLSAGWEPWGVLGAPVLLLAGWNRRTLVGGLMLAATALACYLPFGLAGPFRLFEHSWSVSPFTLAHQVWPRAVRFDWYMRVGQGLVALAAGTVAVLLTRRRTGSSVEAVWAVPAAIVLGRLLLDPLLLDYYWQPVGVLAVMGVGLITRHTPEARSVREARSVVALKVASLTVLGLFATFPAIFAAFQVTVPALSGAATVGLPGMVLFVALSAVSARSVRAA